MKRLVLNILVGIVLLGIYSSIAIYEYFYYNSLYHFLIISIGLYLGYMFYRMEKTISKLYELHKKWLGQ
jgi:hypothetical protein